MIENYLPKLVENQVPNFVRITCRSLCDFAVREGKLHDKRFHDEDDIAGSVPDDIAIEVDLGFLGLQKEYDNIHLPHTPVLSL